MKAIYLYEHPVNNQIVAVSILIGMILPFLFGLLYFSIRRELVIRELRKRTEAAKRANGENVVKYKVEIGYDVFLLHDQVKQNEWLKCEGETKRIAKAFVLSKLKRQAKAYRQRYNSYTKITIKPF
ncbi:hypothetical protein [Mesonia mobilis]|uniref:hypothetical protein n=1 Tax=Mesonia mobilis TaxID=369791 RepID=UPI0026EC1421|nr:hypothetical protein [Mesonia mobilis]